MAQFIPTVPGIGAAFGTGIAKSLDSFTEAKIKQMVEAPQRQAYASALAAILGASPEQVQQDESILSQSQAPGSQTSAQEAVQLAREQQAAQQPVRPRNPNQALLDALQKGGLNEQQLFQLAGLQQQKQLRATEQEKQARKESHAEQKEVNARTQKYYDEVIQKGEAARSANKRLTKMKSLIDKGGLPFSTLYNVINSLEEVSPTSGGTAGGLTGGLIGGPIGAVIGGAAGALISPVAAILRGIQRSTSPNTEEFEKLSADFIRDAKGVFGSRITDADLKAFLKTVPTLSQTDQGKLKIINNLEAFNKASLAEEESLKEVIKEHKGKRPDNLQFLVQERTRKKLDKLAGDFEV